MKLLRPPELVISRKPFTWQGNHRLCVTAQLAFTLTSPSQTIKAAHAWKQLAPLAEQIGGLDAGMPKGRGEFLVAGTCWASQNTPVEALEVAVTVGPQNKHLYVFGDRSWQSRKTNARLPVPTPFQSMPITWANAFGGPGYDSNPIGKGFLDPSPQKRSTAISLPNIEHPNHLIGSINDRPQPVGLGPIPPHWSQRRQLAGTYDQNWKRRDWPGFPSDLNWRFFNCAPDDQRINGYWKGDESIALFNMHPQDTCIETHLPKIRVRCLSGESLADDNAQEPPTNLDTVWLFPDVGIGMLFYRAVFTVADEEASNLGWILCWTESLDDSPTSPDVYLAKVQERRERLPKSEHPQTPPAQPETQLPRKEDVPSEKPLWSSAPGLSRQDITDGHAAGRSFANTDCRGMDYSGLSLSGILFCGADLRGTNFSGADLSAADLTGARLDGATFVNARCSAARFDKATALHACFDQAQLDRISAQQFDATDASFNQARMDSADLRGFQGIRSQFQNASLLQVNATKADFSQANATNAVLKQSILDQACFEQAILDAADLTETHLKTTQMTGVHAVGTRFDKSVMATTDFSSAKLDNAVFDGATGSKVLFFGAQANGISLVKTSLEHVRGNRNTELINAIFTDSDLPRMSMRFAKLPKADFSKARLLRTSFQGAHLDGASFAASNAPNIVFTKANLDHANLTGMNAMHARLRKASLQRADLRQANLYGADVYKVVVDNTRFDGTNLHQTLLADWGKS
ncbi:DUF2169 family type VI secretion system accessory protein [Desulfovibrio inopinatus]|uniref:DUF2169 family type VI secretion system accessory protein n=1 Tax=Desulfovibrio inopinatus TaxID=102109 RepID=UPI0003F7A9BE|nr:DUF2169 domain-containing protein [Desulfovibrio inopinatus]